MTGIMYQWMPGNKYNRTICPDWSACGYSMISVNSPVLSLFDGNDKNCYSWCLSECKKLVYLKNGIVEENGNNDDMKKMSKFWFNFMEDHKETLLNGKLIPYEAEKLYTWAKSDSDKECIVSVYEKDKAVKPTQKKTIYILNGCMGERVIVDILGEYEVNVYNCMGISEIEVPVGGIVKLCSKN